MNQNLHLYIIFTIIVCCVIMPVLAYDELEDGKLTFEELATKYGHPPQKFTVTTEDYYILTLYRLPGTRNAPVLLQHGTLDSSTTWIIRGNSSLAIALVNAGYDVWISNLRGNKYSRRHKFLDPDKDIAFWDFDADHFGVYDLSAIIDTVLQVTGANKLNAIGHSVGNTIFYILGSRRPEYNDKINLMIALAPIAYFNNSYAPVAFLGRNTYYINEILVNTNMHELYGEKTLYGQIVKLVCSNPVIGYDICMNGLLFPLTGFDKTEIKPDFYQVIAEHFPAGISRKVIFHYGQIWRRKKFARFDYGSENIRIYNSTHPPSYNLSAVTMKIVLIVARNDKLTPLSNVNLLRRSLPNVVNFIIHPRKQFNHLDFTWGEHTKDTLFPYIFNALEK